MQSFEQSSAPSENIHKRFTQLQQLDEIPLYKRSTHEKSEIVGETYLFFKEFLTQNGFAEYKNIDKAYQHISDQKYIVRREDPKNIFPLLTEKDGYEIGFQDTRYSNCVTWSPSDGKNGIYNAYMEGFSDMNGIVTVIGFSPQQSDDLIKMEDASQEFNGLDRSQVYSYKGPVSKEKVVFINLRAPGHLLPESELTEEEIEKVDEYLDAREEGKDAQPVMIHRCFLHQKEKGNVH